MSEVKADILEARGAIVLGRESTTSIDIPASGVLTIEFESGSAITLGDGGATELRGIVLLDRTGAPVQLDHDLAVLKSFRAAPGASITIRHEAAEDLDTNPIAAEHRILVSNGADFIMRETQVRMFYTYVTPLTAYRWVANHEVAYFATTPADWPSPTPTSLGDALDIVAARSSSSTMTVSGTLNLAASGSVYATYRGPQATIAGITATLDGMLTAMTAASIETRINEVLVGNGGDGDISIAALDSGAGTSHSATPTANNVVNDGDVIRVTAAPGANMLTTKAAITLLIQPT